VYIFIEEATSYIEPDVRAILNGHITDKNHIEETLDKLLNYLSMSERADKLFKQLCSYCFFIYPELISNYVSFYREHYSDDAIDPDEPYVNTIDIIREAKSVLKSDAMTIITGDVHGDFRHIESMCVLANTTKDDLLIILGDAGVNYYGGKKEREFKKLLSELPITMFCIHGNHERRPETLGTYHEENWQDGVVYIESEFPNLLFAKDGEVYTINNKRCIAIGGAYSVDKEHRIAHNWGWWPDEQPSEEIKQRVEKRLEQDNWHIDVVLSHTAPLKYEPREMFLEFIDDSKVDKSTEVWLDTIEDRLDYDYWFCGHYHTNKIVDKIRFLYRDFYEFR